MFGPIPPNDFNNLQQLAQKLAEWRNPHEEAVPSSSSASSPSFASAPIAASAPEWGSGLHLEFGMIT